MYLAGRRDKDARLQQQARARVSFNRSSNLFRLLRASWSAESGVARAAAERVNNERGQAARRVSVDFLARRRQESQLDY